MSRLNVFVVALSAVMWLGGCATDSGDDGGDSQASEQQAVTSEASISSSPQVGEIDYDPATKGVCPINCLSDEACTIGCSTEAVCISRRCWPL
jgi:hypothetical protein